MPIRHAVVFVLFLLCAASAQAQNLLANPGFDADLASWSEGEGSQGSVNHEAADGDSANGSAQFDATACCTLSISQCLPVDPSTDYEFGGSVRLAGATLPAGGDEGLGFDLQWSSDATCTAPVGTAALNVPNTEGWVRHVAATTSPGNAQSVLFRARQFNFVEPHSLSARVDDVVFGPAGTVPVELQQFSVE